MSLDPSSITFHDAHQHLLRELDEAWSDLRAFHAKLTLTNPDYQDYKDAKDRFKTAQEAVWRLKTAWFDSK